MSSSVDLPPKLLDFLNEMRAPLPPITDPDQLLDIDSLSLMRLCGFLENDMAITVDADELTFDNFETARSLASLIRTKTEKSPAGQLPDQMTPARDYGDWGPEDTTVDEVGENIPRENRG